MNLLCSRMFSASLRAVALLAAIGIGFGAPGFGRAGDRFPAQQWEVAEDRGGWSQEKLAEARDYADSIDTAAVVIVHRGRIVEQWGETERQFNCHSMRKSILSALYGIQVADKRIDPDRTMEQLGIDDKEPSLTEDERRATVRDLLKARSGVYHAALYETAAMKAARPERWSRAPGEFWYYNNWDFNALGTIYRNVIARDIFEDFEEYLARPLAMQDFDRAAHTRYVTGNDSVHAAYPIQLSARDLARFGLLFARGGRWQDRQIIPEAWVAESTTSYSDAGERGGYGYLWWIAQDGRHYPGAELPEGAFSARGAGGHCILVVPQWDLVVVHRVNTFQRSNRVSASELGKLIGLIVAARPEEDDDSEAAEDTADKSRKSSPESETAEAAASNEPPFDWLFVGGRVMDGTGNPWFLADVGVRDGRIAAIGRLRDHAAEHVIDLAGKVIAPGFIDLHSHADRGLTSKDDARRAAPNLVTQGITTVVVNQDGFGPASIRSQQQAMIERGVGPNVIQMTGHGAIRGKVMGSDHRRAATEEETAEMVKLLRDALEVGGFGMSAGLEYVPGRWSTTEELQMLVAELAKDDHVYIAHERSSGADPMWYLPSRDGENTLTMIDNLNELIEIAEATGARVVATHIKARGRNFWGSSRIMAEMIRDARARGVRLYADQYPYDTSGSDGSIVLLPEWLSDRAAKLASSGSDDSENESDTPAAALRSPADELELALAASSVAASLRRDVEHEIARRGGPERIVIMEHPDQSVVSLTLGEFAGRLELEPVEAVIRLQLDGRRDRRGGARLRAYSMDEGDIEMLAAQPWTATCTDAGIALPNESKPVHPRYYGAFPRKIYRYAIQRGVMTVEDAVRTCTSLPAQILGLQDRGLVRVGNHADLVVFDPDSIRDVATAEDPHRYSEGIEYVLVGGTAVVDPSGPTGALAGKVIRRGE